MNLNYETYIKQEFLNEEHELNTFPIADFNIPIKNEPICDELMPLVTIKNEPLNETPLTAVVSQIKKEDPIQSQISIPGNNNSFVVYELETPSITQHVRQVKTTPKTRQFINEASCSQTELNTLHSIPQIPANSNTSLMSQIFQNPALNNTTAKPTTKATRSHDNRFFAPERPDLPSAQDCQPRKSCINRKFLSKGDTSGDNSRTATTTTTKATPPVLLNAQLRKRNKVVVHTNTADKKARYNIELVKVTVKDIIPASINAIEPTVTSEATSVGGKKIINHLIKNKNRNQRKLGDHTVYVRKRLENEKSTNRGIALQNKIPLMELNDKPSESVTENLKKFNTNEMKTKTNPYANSNSLFTKTIPPPSSAKNANTSKYTLNTPELRVKCLCSLTADTSNNLSYNLAMRDFFQEMFEKTRRLNKKQQRKIRMTLLQVILDAEESVEKGKCCGF